MSYHYPPPIYWNRGFGQPKKSLLLGPSTLTLNILPLKTKGWHGCQTKNDGRCWESRCPSELDVNDGPFLGISNVSGCFNKKIGGCKTPQNGW